MSSLPRVTVCVVTYNHEDLIGPCLDSVMAQARDADLEVLVGDDASSDATAAVVARYVAAFPDHIRLIHRPANLGAAGNYRDLMLQATGDFVAHLDGDDLWLPGKLAAQLRALSEHPQCPAAFTNAMVVDDNGALVGAFTNAQPALFDLNYLAERGNFLMHSSLVYRREHLPALTQLPVPFIDYQLHLTLARSGPLAFVNACHAVYRQGTAHSMIRRQRMHVELMAWQSLRSALPHLNARTRWRGVSFLVGAMLLTHLRMRSPALAEVLGQAAQELQSTRIRVVWAALPQALAIWMRSRWRSIGRAFHRQGVQAVHARPMR